MPPSRARRRATSLNARPPTVDGRRFDLNLAAGSRASTVDCALWGDLIPGNPEDMDDLAARGTIGLAEEAGCALHVVHVATGAGVALVTQPSGPQGFTASDDEPAEYLLYEDADRDGF